MTKRVIRVVVIVAVAVGSAGSLQAQSLGDIAKKEESRRKQVEKPAKVYTNESLRGSDRPEGTAAASQSVPSGSAAAEPSPQQPAGEATSADGEKRDEKYWRERMKAVQDNLERTRTFEEALQARINALTTEFTNRDDPAQRQVVANNRQKALAELDRVKKEIASFEKQVGDTEEEARRAGVPAGWLR